MSSVQYDPVSAPRVGPVEVVGRTRLNAGKWVAQSRSAGSGFRRSRNARPSGGPRPQRAKKSRQVQDGSIVSLFWRVFLLNAARLLRQASFLLSRRSISTPTRVIEEAVLALGVLLLLAANYVVLRPAFAPLEQLAERMRCDLLRPGAA